MIYGILETPYNDKVGKLGKTLYKIMIFEPKNWPRDDSWFTWRLSDKKEHNIDYLPLAGGASATYEEALEAASAAIEKYHKERIRKFEIIITKEE